MTTDPHMIIIFGANGDLTKRKLIPAMYHLELHGTLHETNPIICVSRENISREVFLQKLETTTFIKNVQQDVLERVLDRIHYVCADINTISPEAFAKQVRMVEKQRGCAHNKLFYLAIPSQLFAPVVELIRPFIHDKGWQRVVFEKPFGHDEQSAKEINEHIGRIFAEEQVFRIDHYMGKTLVHNILSLRFSNMVFEPLWNCSAVERVEINAAETVGVELRGGYYDKAGAIKDMVQNHLLQLFSLITMEPPKSLNPNDIRDATAGAIRSAEFVKLVRGQYAKGKGLAAYVDEPKVKKDSMTETYARLVIHSNEPRWKGVPFIITTGKRMEKKDTRVRIIFRHTGLYHEAAKNELVIRIQPDEGIAMTFNVKPPIRNPKLQPENMDFCLPCKYGPNTPEAYEALLFDVMHDDHTLFIRRDWLEASWHFIDGLPKTPLYYYPAMSSGPADE